MAEIISNENGAKKKGKKRAKRLPTHIDMTPMVDLACLLLTFFMLTAAFTKPKVMEIVLPKKGPESKISKPRVVNIILDGKDRVFYYNGLADPNSPPLPNVYLTDFGKNGIRKILLNRNKDLYLKLDSFNSALLKGNINYSKEQIAEKLKELRSADKTGPIVLIKATDKAKYKNVVAVVNEMAVANIARYSIADLSEYEEKLLAKTKRDLKISD